MHFRERLQQTLGDDASSQQSDNNIFLDVVQGATKKGCIYGLGTEGGKYRPSTSSTSSFEGNSQAEYERMRDLVTNLTVKNKNLKIPLESHKELKGQSFNAGQMCQFMERSAQGRSIVLPLHPPSSTDQNNQQNEGDGFDDGFE